MPTNYEAIGRCKVLAKEIEALKANRNAAIMELRRQLYATAGASSITSAVFTFNAEQAHDTMKALEAADVELMQAITEFNEWAPEADERMIQVKAPRES